MKIFVDGEKGAERFVEVNVCVFLQSQYGKCACCVTRGPRTQETREICGFSTQGGLLTKAQRIHALGPWPGFFSWGIAQPTQVVQGDVAIPDSPGGLHQLGPAGTTGLAQVGQIIKFPERASLPVLAPSFNIGKRAYILVL